LDRGEGDVKQGSETGLIAVLKGIGLVVLFLFELWL
jgi:hypothetical protein